MASWSVRLSPEMVQVNLDALDWIQQEAKRKKEPNWQNVAARAAYDRNPRWDIVKAATMRYVDGVLFFYDEDGEITHLYPAGSYRQVRKFVEPPVRPPRQ